MKLKIINLDFVFGAIIALSLLFAAWYPLHGDIIFHSDIARDMTILDEAVSLRKVFLIGEGIRGIPGLYHGPAWLYLNLPAFIIGGGNPITVGWFWLLLVIAYVVSVYVIGTKIFNKPVAIIAAAIIASRVPLYSHQLINPNGAFLLFPTFFYFMWRYLNTKSVRNLIAAVIIGGMLIQFEIMFGIPMLVVLGLLTLWMIITNKVRFTHIFFFAFLAIPLITYFVFDIRHDYIQIKTFIAYITGNREVVYTMREIVINRFNEMTLSLGLLSRGTSWIYKLLGVIFFGCVARGLKKDNYTGFFGLYTLTYLVFWTYSLIFPEPIKGYYFDFSVLNAFILTSQLTAIHKYFGIALLVPMIYVNIAQAKVVAFLTYDFSGNQGSSWIYNHELGKLIAADAPQEFSVFTLDTDIWGYSANYGIRYAADRDGKTVNFQHKSQITYLVISKETINHKNFDVRWWREDQVKIKANPTKTWMYKDHFIIEKYELSPEEIAVTEDVNLMSTNYELR